MSLVDMAMDDGCEMKRESGSFSVFAFKAAIAADSTVVHILIFFFSYEYTVNFTLLCYEAQISSERRLIICFFLLPQLDFNFS